MAEPNEKSLEAELGITPLRFEGGVLIVYLSDDNEDILVLPLDILAQHSHWFKSGSHINWQEPQVLEGGSVLVHQFALSFDSEFKSWTLQNKEQSKLQKLPDVNINTLPRLYSTIIPARSDENDEIGFSEARKRCVIAHKFLFSVVFGLPVSHNEIAKFSSVFGDALILAEFYLMLPTLGSILEKLIHGQWQLDGDLIEESKFYLGIAEVLRSRPILEEAMRHHVGRGEFKENSFD